MAEGTLNYHMAKFSIWKSLNLTLYRHLILCWTNLPFPVTGDNFLENKTAQPEPNFIFKLWISFFFKRNLHSYNSFVTDIIIL